MRLTSVLLLLALSSCTDWRDELSTFRSDRPLPRFPLVDQHGEPVSLHDERTLITFAFSRCAVPTACPQTIEKIREVEDRVRTVVVTLDPEHDTPDVLRAWSQRSGLQKTTFATGSREVVDGVTSCFNVFTTKDMAHPVKAALLEGGRVVKTWSDNTFSAAELSGGSTASGTRAKEEGNASTDR